MYIVYTYLLTKLKTIDESIDKVAMPIYAWVYI